MTTPGPWHRAGPEHPCCNVANIEDSAGVRVAEVSEEYDVAIIEQAPALADTLKKLLAWAREQEDAQDWPDIVHRAADALLAAGVAP